MKRMFIIVSLVWLASALHGALRQVNSLTIDQATFIPTVNWNQKGDMLAARITASGLSLALQRAGTSTPAEYPVSDGAGLIYTAVYPSDDLTYVVVDARNGDLHYCYCYKIGSSLKRVATYSWNGALSGGRILQQWCGASIVVAQQTDAAGSVSVAVYAKGLKSQIANVFSTHAAASESPAVRVSPHGRYIALERSYHSAAGVRRVDVRRLTSTSALVLDKDMASWPVWHGPDDTVVIYGLQAGGVS